MGSGLRLLELSDDTLGCILAHLEPEDFYAATSACGTLRSFTSSLDIVARLPLGPEEEPSFPLARRMILSRLAAAGNAPACYRLGGEQGKEEVLRSSPLVDPAMHMAASIAPDALVYLP